MAFRAQAFPPRRSRESERLDKTERHLRAGIWLARSAPKEASQWDLCSKLGLAQTPATKSSGAADSAMVMRLKDLLRLEIGHRNVGHPRRATQPVWFGFKPVRIQVLPPSGERNTPETRTNETTCDV